MMVEQAESGTELHRSKELHLPQTILPHLQAVIGSISEGIVIADPKGHVLMMNGAALSLHGYSGIDGIQGPYPGFPDTFEFHDLAGQPLPGERWPLARALGGETFSDCEVRVRRRDTGKVWIGSYGGTPIRDGRGEMVLAVVTVRDITERHRAEEERATLLVRERQARARAEAAEQRAAFLARASKILAGAIDHEASWVSLSHLAVPFVADYCLIFQAATDGELHLVAKAHVDPQKEAMLCRIAQLYRGIMRNPASYLARAVRTGRPQLLRQCSYDMAKSVTDHQELLDIYRCLDPKSAMFIPLISRDQVLGVIALVSADSNRHYGEHDLQLAWELGQRAAGAMENSRLFRQAKEANAAKDHFLAVLSHELRTPLTPVLMAAAELESDQRLSRDAREAVRLIRRNVGLEARLIDDLLDLNRIARGKLKLQMDEISVHETLDHAIEVCRGDLRAKELSLATDLRAANCQVRGDAARLQQVFWNLIKNAIKFTPEGGKIAVRTWNGESGLPGLAVSLFIEISDTGIGIESEFLPQLFNAFEQGGKGTTRQFGGLGLGLAISKALVEMHGGTIRAESLGREKGARFTVELRILPAPSAMGIRSTQKFAAARSSRGRRILLVEDHPDTLRLMCRLLENLNHQVTAADCVESALKAAAAEPFDLVISDLGLPDGSGLDLMRQLKGRFGLIGIALSGFGMEEDFRKSAEAGFSEHLIKPVDLSRLQVAIDRLAS